MANEQQIREHIKELLLSSVDRPIPAAEFDERLTQAYELRDFIQKTIPERLIKEAIIAGGLYRPSRLERVHWALQDHISLIKDRFFRH